MPPATRRYGGTAAVSTVRTSSPGRAKVQPVVQGQAPVLSDWRLGVRAPNRALLICFFRLQSETMPLASPGFTPGAAEDHLLLGTYANSVAASTFRALIVGRPVSGGLLVSFQCVLDRRERFLEVGNRPAHRSLPNDGSLGARQTCLLGTHGHDQIEAGLLRVVSPADTEG